jgi:ketosteroid isomerase-like protein
VQLEVVLDEPRTVPFRPPRYSFDFADTRDASRIAALGAQYTLDGVRQSLATGNDEWITARRGRDIVAAVCIRTEEQWLVHTVDAPVVAAQHVHSGLERYLTHLAEVWVQSLTLRMSA